MRIAHRVRHRVRRRRTRAAPRNRHQCTCDHLAERAAGNKEGLTAESAETRTKERGEQLRNIRQAMARYTDHPGHVRDTRSATDAARKRDRAQWPPRSL